MKFRSMLPFCRGIFESLSASVLERAGETKESFMEKLKNSQRKIIDALNGEVETVYPLEVLKGEAVWQSQVTEVKTELEDGSMGRMEAGEVDMDKIFNARKSLYKAWNPDQDINVLRHHFYGQCAEYAVLGSVLMQSFANPVLVGADHKKMQPFYWFFGRMASLYVNREYEGGGFNKD